MKTLSEIIRNVLDDMAENQVNLSSGGAREMMARLIASALIAEGVQNEVNDDNDL
jgi:hypothetical protein